MECQNKSNGAALNYDYLSLARSFSDCGNKTSFQRTCTYVAQTLGYNYYLFGNYFPTTDSVVLSSNFPKEWRKRYSAQGYSSIDPTLQHCWIDSNVIDWNDLVYSRGVTGDSEKVFMDEAKLYGLNSGISIPIHGVGAESGILSLATARTTSEDARPDDLGLHVIAQSMSLSMKKIYNIPKINLSPKLSNREDECMAWTAKGKTSWEIARILDISKETVIFHIRNSISKLEATNRPQAVANAISQRVIRPF